MIAGAICEETDCTLLVLFVLGAAAAVVALVTAVAVVWAIAISAALQRRGWTRAKRRATATGIVIAMGAVVWQVAVVVPDLTWYLMAVTAIPAVPVAIWQRELTRRAQSRPRSTA